MKDLTDSARVSEVLEVKGVYHTSWVGATWVTSLEQGWSKSQKGSMSGLTVEKKH